MLDVLRFRLTRRRFWLRWMIHARNFLTSELGGRVILFVAGLAIGLAALAFAMLADQANAWFAYCHRQYLWWPLLVTPLGFALTVWLMH